MPESKTTAQAPQESELQFGSASDAGVTSSFWSTEQFADDWDINLHKILPKRGGLSDVKNYRGIMLREIFAKVLFVIIMFYLEPIIESTLAGRVEDQSGFRGN